MGLSPLNRGVVRPDTIFRCDDYNLPHICRNFNIFHAEIFHFLQTQFDELCRKPKKMSNYVILCYTYIIRIILYIFFVVNYYIFNFTKIIM